MDVEIRRASSSATQFTLAVVLLALAFIVAIAVSQAIQKILDSFLNRENSVTGYVIYALLTILIVFLIVWALSALFPGAFGGFKF